jgi:hypothetical protein
MINDMEIVRPTQLLDKGLPIPFLEGKYVVDQGWCAVITEGGAFKEILPPGMHYLGRYRLFHDIKAIAVDTRIKNLTVSTTREFSIAQPVPVEVNLDLSVEYRVADPLRVATEITSPLTGLFDRVIQAVRGAVVNASIDEIRTQGEGIARSALQRLQAMQLRVTLGLEVMNVLTTSIKATDVGNDALAQLQMGQFTKVQDWRVDNAIMQQTQVTPQWLMINRPELYAQLMAGNQEIIKEMVDKGLVDPAGFLNQPTNAPAYNPANFLSGMGIPGLNPPNLPNVPNNTPVQSPQGSVPQLSGGMPTGGGSKDIHSRMREELPYLEKLPGVRLESKAGADNRGIPDGSYNLRIRMPRSSGGEIIIYFTCDHSFPQTPPLMDVEIGGESTPFQSAILRRWNGQYLVEIVREIKQYFG